jgi:hypothetical protein
MSVMRRVHDPLLILKRIANARAMTPWFRPSRESERCNPSNEQATRESMTVYWSNWTVGCMMQSNKSQIASICCDWNERLRLQAHKAFLVASCEIMTDLVVFHPE